MPTPTEKPAPELVRRPALIFRFGDYTESHGFALAPDEFAKANASTDCAPIDLRHKETALDGHLGHASDFDVRGEELHGNLYLPTWLDEIVRAAPDLRLSPTFGMNSKRLRKVSLESNPHIEDAELLAAFSRSQSSVANDDTQSTKDEESNRGADAASTSMIDSESEGRDTDKAGLATGDQDDKASDEGKDKSDDTKPVFSRVQVKEMIDERLKQERAASERKRLKDAEAAKQKSLAETGQFQLLAEQYKAELDLNRPKIEAADRYAEWLNQVIDGEVKGWPEEVRKTDPGADNIDARKNWVEKTRDLAKTVLNLRKAPNTELQPGKGKAGDPKALMEKTRQDLQKIHHYQRF